MKKILLSLSLVILLTFLLVNASPTYAGSRNATKVRYIYRPRYEMITSYWQKTESGIVHEWRYDVDGYDLHKVFKPADKFDEPDCDDENLSHSPTDWSYDNSIYMDWPYFSEGALSSFIKPGDLYHVCEYRKSASRKVIPTYADLEFLSVHFWCFEGGTCVYEEVIYNNGPDTAEGVNIDITVEPESALVSGPFYAGSSHTSCYSYWYAPCVNHVFRTIYMQQGSGQVEFTLTVSSDNDPNLTNNTITETVIVP